MSHFAVIVITPDLDKVDELLAPYQENNMGDCPKQYLEFNDETEDLKREYETRYVTRLRFPNGSFGNPYAEEYRKMNANRTGFDYQYPEGAEKVEVLAKDAFPTFESFMAGYYGVEPDPETGKYGSWENPNAKWDWYTEGGRARGMLRFKAGGNTDAGKIKDLDFGATNEEIKAAKRFWEVVVEGAEPLDGEQALWNFYKPEYYQEQYGSKDEYVASNVGLIPWAFVTPDGKWYEQGEMGWFACSDATKNSRKAFREFWQKTVRETDPEYYMVVVDCHI